jgi:hypothetical protein
MMRLRALAVLWPVLVLPSRALADGCAADTDCKADRRCIEGQCQVPTPSCQHDRDCPGEQVCERGQCVVPAAPPMDDLTTRPSPPPTGIPLAWEVVAGGGLQAQAAGVGFGWQASLALGVRPSPGLAVLGLGTYSRAASAACDGSVAACVVPPVLHLGTFGLGVRYLSQRRGATTTGLVRVIEPFTPGGDQGWGLSTRYHYGLVPGFALTLESLVAVLGNGMAYTLGVGVGWTD